MLLSGDGKYRMSELVEQTGFPERQIRFYLAQKLAPGAESRGAAAVYGQATLDRLLLIRHLKEIRVKPANRALTLDEMRQTMDALGNEGAMRLTSDMAQLQIIDTDELLPQRLDNAKPMECHSPRSATPSGTKAQTTRPPRPTSASSAPSCTACSTRWTS